MEMSAIPPDAENGTVSMENEGNWKYEVGFGEMLGE
jgi:hypothetical protein